MVRTKYEKHNRPSVPRLKIDFTKEDFISAQLRAFDNKEITNPFGGAEVYVTTNELIGEEIHLALTHKPVLSNGVHIGFSGLHNFDIMAQRKSSRALICDLNPENAFFYYHVLKILCESENREQLLDKIEHFIFEHADLPWYHAESIAINANITDSPLYEQNPLNTSEKQLRIELQRPTSWLFTEESFNFIKQLAEQDKIAVITENITNSSNFRKIHQKLTDNGLVIDTLYVSNIFQVMPRKDMSGFISSMEALTDEGTLLIDAKQDANQNLSQRAASLAELNFYDWFYKRIYNDLEDCFFYIKEDFPVGNIPESIQKVEQMTIAFFQKNEAMMKKEMTNKEFSQFKENFLLLLSATQDELNKDGVYTGRIQKIITELSAKQEQIKENNSSGFSPENQSPIPIQVQGVDVVQQEIKRLKNTSGFFSNSAHNKAAKIEKAVASAIQNAQQGGITDIRKNNDVRAALSEHRIFSFFGLKKAQSLINIENSLLEKSNKN